MTGREHEATVFEGGSDDCVLGRQAESIHLLKSALVRIKEIDLRCVECGNETDTVRLCAPLDRDIPKEQWLALCDDCWNDYVQQVLMDQSYDEAVREPERE